MDPATSNGPEARCHHRSAEPTRTQSTVDRTVDIVAAGHKESKMMETILAIEDGRGVCSIDSQTLGAAGYRVLHTPPGEVACAQARECRPALILYPASPGDDADALQALRAAAGPPNPFVALVSDAAAGPHTASADALGDGADGHLYLPLSAAALLAQIRAFLDIRALKAALDAERQGMPGNHRPATEDATTTEKAGHSGGDAELQAAMREGDGRYRAFLDASTDMAFLKDASLRYVMVNTKYRAYMGRSELEILGKDDADLMPEGMAQTCRLSDEEALSAGAIVINREQVGDRIYETHKFAVPLGETLGVGGFVRDITDQIWAQQEIRRSEARLRSVVNVLQHPAETAQDVLDFALDEAVRLTDSEMGFLNTYDEDLRQFRLIALSGSATADRRLSSLRQVADLDQTGLWGEAVRQRKPIMLNDFRTPNPLRRGLPEGHAPLRRFLSVPFNYEGKLVAVVAVANKTTDYTEVDGLQLSLLMDVVWRTLLHRDADAALQQEKENLAAVLAAAPIAMLVFDEHEEVLMANPAAAQAFGKQGSELLHLRCGDLIACVHRQQDPRGCGYSGDCTVCPLTGALRRALSGVGSADLSGEAAFTLRTSPEPVWMRYRVNPVTLYGRPSAVLALDDITNRRRAEEARAQERRLLRTVIDNLPDSVYVKDVRARKMLANRVDLDFMGADTEASVLGKTDLETYPTEVAEPLLVDDRHVLETGEPVRDREEIVTDGTGRKRWLLTSKFPLRDQAGEIVGLVGTGRDITERHQADVERRRLVAQIEAQAHQLQDILETVPEGVLVLQGGGAIVLANPAAQHALAILAPDIDGKVTHLGSRPLDELLTSAPRGSWYEVQAGNHTYEITSRPVLHSIDADRWVVVINDVTQRREVQDHLHQQARLAAVGQLAAGIAHDFNNIMAVIVLQAELVARSGGLTVHDRERLATVNQQAQFATRLIEQILDFSRRSMLSRHPLNLVPQLKEQVMLLQRTLPEHIRVELTYDDEQCTVDADPTRVQQMIVNLAINARDAMP